MSLKKRQETIKDETKRGLFKIGLCVIYKGGSTKEVKKVEEEQEKLVLFICVREIEDKEEFFPFLILVIFVLSVYYNSIS